MITIYTDATAALGLIGKEGLGRARHIDTGVLWLQQKRLKNELTYGKVAGVDNAADMFTKNLAREKMNKFLAELGYRFADGRADGAVELYDVEKEERTTGRLTTEQDKTAIEVRVGKTSKPNKQYSI